jgi:hypothetical protein
MFSLFGGCDLFNVSLVGYVKDTAGEAGGGSPGGTTLYSISVPGSVTGGSIAADKTEATAGELVTLTVVPESGYRIAFNAIRLNGTGGSVNGSGTTFSFNMPAVDVVVSAEFGSSGMVAHLLITGGYYSSLDAAVGAAANSDTITVLADINDSTKMGANSITIVGKHIRLTASPGPGQEWEIKRWSGNTGNLFTVSGTGILEIGAETGSLAIDGGAVWKILGVPSIPTLGAGNSGLVANNVATPESNSSLIVVDGHLRIESGAILRNNEFKNDTGAGGGGGAIYNTGVVEIFGGKIMNNKTGGRSTNLYGGAIKNQPGASLTITGGEISGNYAEGSSPGGRGGAILNNGTFIMNGGIISGNKAGTTGGGIATENGSTGTAKFIFIHGTVYGTVLDLSLINIAPSGGASVFVGSGIAKLDDETTGTSITTISTTLSR